MEKREKRKKVYVGRWRWTGYADGPRVRILVILAHKKTQTGTTND